MEYVHSVERVIALAAELGGERLMVVAAEGTVPTSGWSHPRLSPRIYITPPADGLWELDFYADPPAEIVLEVMLPITALMTLAVPNWCKGVRVIAATNDKVAKLGGPAPLALGAKDVSRSELGERRPIYRQKIAHYEDSWQFTGGSKIDWGGVHFEMKKLVHDLVLTVEGPDEGKIRHCIDQALKAGVLAAIIAAFSTGGLGAIGAGLKVAEAALLACLGSGYTIRFNDDSHWEYWWT